MSEEYGFFRQLALKVNDFDNPTNPCQKGNGACCKRGVAVTPEDEILIAQAVQRGEITQDVFEKIMDNAADPSREACDFFSDEERYCMAYRFRPVQCAYWSVAGYPKEESDELSQAAKRLKDTGEDTLVRYDCVSAFDCDSCQAEITDERRISAQAVALSIPVVNYVRSFSGRGLSTTGELARKLREKVIGFSELSSITRETLGVVDSRMRDGISTINGEGYTEPILELLTHRPDLATYYRLRTFAALTYKSPEASIGYKIGTAIGFDIMKTHAFSLRRRVSISNLEIAMHDPEIVAVLALVSKSMGAAMGLIDRDWFDRNWLSADIETGRSNFQEETLEVRNFYRQLARGEYYTPFFANANRLFRGQGEMVRQGVQTGIFDQSMIWHHTLRNTNKPGQEFSWP